ncbi:MAG: hypothetical protein ACREX3_08085 [Gammaproteobacteria bacterium]
MALNLDRHALIAVVLAAGAGCNTASGPDLPMCSGSVVLTLNVSPTPTLVWTPNCRVDHVLVEVPLPPSSGGGSDVTWQIAVLAEGQGVVAPVPYGVVPPSMQELVAAEPLQAGAFYRIRIYASEVTVGDLNVQYWPPD